MRRVFLLLASLATLALATPAFAMHRHVIQVGNGSCVLLAQAGNERFVDLPDASFNNTTEPTTTANPHPLHVHVHRGQPGQVLTIAVYGSASDPCAASGDYLNLQP